MHEKMIRNLEFVFGVCIFFFVLAGVLCCCYINPMICQEVRHRKKIIPIKENKEEKSDDDIINPMQIHIV